MIPIAVSLAGYMLMLIYSLRMPYAAAPTAAVSTITLVLYLSGLLEILPLATISFFWLGILLLPATLLFNYKYPRFTYLSLLQPGLIVFFVGFALLYFKLIHSYYSNTDEFAHWGLIVKEMIYYDSLSKPFFTSGHRAYPPGTALWAYFINKNLGYSPGLTNFAQALFILAPLCLVLQNITWRQRNLLFVTVLALYFALYVFGHGFKSTMVDHVLGVYFGCVLADYFLAKDKYKLVRTTLLLAVLPLIKTSGILFAAVAAIAISLDILLNKQNKRIPKLCMLWLPLLFTKFSWSAYLIFYNVKDKFTQANAESPLFSFLQFSFTPEQLSIMGKFFASLATLNIGRVPRDWSTALFWLVVLAGFAYLAYRRTNNTTQKRMLIFAGTLLAGLAVYTFGLLLLYLYTFIDWEATDLASYGRYMGSYFLGLFLFALGFWLSVREEHPLSKVAPWALTALLLAIAPWKAFNFLYEAPGPGDRITSILAAYEASPLHEKLTPRDLIYVDWEGDFEYDPLVFIYLNAPAQSRMLCPEGLQHWSCDDTAPEEAIIWLAKQ